VTALTRPRQNAAPPSPTTPGENHGDDAMPIRPENKARYPKNWKEIRERILSRAGQRRTESGVVMLHARCEWCGVRNHAFGTRNARGNFYEMGMTEADVAHLEGERVVKIILTIAHLDHTPENCADDNLAALCQRCHNRYDVVNRRRGIRERQAANTGELFKEVPHA
jgi:5-methylcytosine-specific restriction endonuclease McrA